MKKSIERLTNEEISKKFDNQFELVLYAIKIAENMIQTGRDPRVKADTQNKALLTLQEILNGKDAFDDIAIEELSTLYKGDKEELNSK